MAQKIKLGSERTPALPVIRRPFFAHPTSHLLLWEEEAHARLLGVPVISCGDPKRALSAGDVEDQLDAAMDGMGSGGGPCAVFVEVGDPLASPPYSNSPSF